MTFQLQAIRCSLPVPVGPTVLLPWYSIPCMHREHSACLKACAFTTAVYFLQQPFKNEFKMVLISFREKLCNPIGLRAIRVLVCKEQRSKILISNLTLPCHQRSPQEDMY